MKCSDLFESVKAYWRNEVHINVTDAEQLNRLYWEADSEVNSETQPWLDIGIWAFHQALGIFIDAKKDFGNVVVISEVPIELFHKQMLFNLSEECWAKERSEYMGP